MERHITPAGNLGVLHFKELDFEPKRIYWLYETPDGAERGWHAHKTLEQFIFCVSGSVEVELDDGRNKATHRLDSAGGGLAIKPGQWRTLRGLTRNTVVMVLASHDYDPDDYIHDYEEFLTWARHR